MLCKVLVVGNAKCGKTSIIKRFASPKDTFVEKYNTTVGADFVRRDLQMAPPANAAAAVAAAPPTSPATFRTTQPDDMERGSAVSPPTTKPTTPAVTPTKSPAPTTTVRMQLWDIAGQDRFAKLTRAYFRKAKAAAIVCDLTREGTLEAVRQWKKELDAFTTTTPTTTTATTTTTTTTTTPRTEPDGGSDNGGGAAGQRRGLPRNGCNGGNNEVEKSGSDGEPGGSGLNGSSSSGGGCGGGKLPVVLFANKCDLLAASSSSEAFVLGARMEALCRELGIVAWFVTSAKDGSNIEAGFRHLADLAMANEAEAAAIATAAASATAAAAVTPAASTERGGINNEKGSRIGNNQELLSEWKKSSESGSRSHESKIIISGGEASEVCNVSSNGTLLLSKEREHIGGGGCSASSGHRDSTPFAPPLLLPLSASCAASSDNVQLPRDQENNERRHDKRGASPNDNHLLQVWDIDDF